MGNEDNPAPAKKARGGGCSLIGLVLLVLVIGMMGYCGLSVYSMATVDMPKIRIQTEEFVKHYNAGDYDAIYAAADPEVHSAISKEKNAVQVARIKGLTGVIVLGAQGGWNAQNMNGRKSVSVSYACTSEKGDVILTMRYHYDDAWKWMGYNVNLK